MEIHIRANIAWCPIFIMRVRKMSRNVSPIFYNLLLGGIQHITPFIALRIDSSWEHDANRFSGGFRGGGQGALAPAPGGTYPTFRVILRPPFQMCTVF